MPSRTLTNKSVDEEAIPGEDTSEVSYLHTWQAWTNES
jgi:hypothetical protein